MSARISELSVAETFGAPEFFVDGCVAVTTGAIVHIICYVERTAGGRTERQEVVRLHMAADRYQAEVFAAMQRLREGRGH